MPVTKQSYSAAATWSASQLADLFRSAFIDAGLMGDWHDAFVSGGIENRILRIVNDSSKSYGTVFYWFMVTTTGVFIHTALGWNTTTRVPTGTLYLDYFSTTTNSTSNHQQLLTASLSTAVGITLIRYTSGVHAGVSWFLLRNGTVNRAFMVPSASFNALPFVDQSKIAFNGVLLCSNGSTTGNFSSLGFWHSAGHTRRTFLAAATLRGSTTSLNFAQSICVHQIFSVGNQNNDFNSNLFSSVGLMLPVAMVNTQAGLASDHAPVFTGPAVSPYMAALPSDFGVVAFYASSAMAVQDRFIVAASTEEWEVISVAANPATNAGRIMLLARIVG